MMLNRICDVCIPPIASRVLDVLEWFYDHDVKRRRHNPFGG